MQNSRTHRSFTALARWSWLLVAFLLVSCAAPAPPQAAMLQAPEHSPEVRLYVNEFDASGADLTKILSQIDSDPQTGFSGVNGAQDKFRLGLPVNDDGGIKTSSEISLSDSQLSGLFSAVVAIDAAFSCMEVEDQAYWIINQATVTALLDNQTPLDPEVEGLLADCSDVAESLVDGAQCEDCGCIGPMGGNPSHCPTTGMRTWNPQPIWK